MNCKVHTYVLFKLKGNRGEYGKEKENKLNLNVFLREGEEEFGVVLITFNPSFLIPQIREIWRKIRI